MFLVEGLHQLSRYRIEIPELRGSFRKPDEGVMLGRKSHRGSRLDSDVEVELPDAGAAFLVIEVSDEIEDGPQPQPGLLPELTLQGLTERFARLHTSRRELEESLQALSGSPAEEKQLVALVAYVRAYGKPADAFSPGRLQQ
jgi:hypothetical protein